MLVPALALRLIYTAVSMINTLFLSIHTLRYASIFASLAVVSAISSTVKNK